ncbi:MAG TPA: FAD-binding oxidoreductase [Roseiflexaceae bacterium]|nr:FAD-binding oxidoreductase [Roseiflexaceae bacterium]
MHTYAETREYRVMGKDLRPLLDGLCGEVFTAESGGYDAARALWNGRFDRRPALIVRPACAEDVARAVAFAREAGLPVSVRGGGHSLAGFGVADGALALDMSALKHIRVNPEDATVRAEAGVLAGELDQALHPHGLAVPVGTISLVGVAGLTLGGGIGWLTRKYGLTLDNLEAVELVTAEGRALTASERDHPELFWGLRGGGGNFGVVTAFTFRAQPVPTEVLGGPLFYALDQAPTALRLLRDIMEGAPEELAAMATLMTAPPAAPFPEHMWGRLALAIDLCYAGPEAEGERALRPLRESGLHELDIVRRIPFLTRQRSSDGKIRTGHQHDGASRYLQMLSDGAIDALVEAFARVNSPLHSARLVSLGGAAARVPAAATAYPHRGAAYALWLGAVWGPGEPAAPHRAWMRSALALMRPYTGDATYVNILSDEGELGVRAAYGHEHYRRLQALKRAYDPENRFSSNQNIRP